MIDAHLRARKGHFADDKILAAQFADLEEPTDAIVVDIRLVAGTNRRRNLQAIEVIQKCVGQHFVVAAATSTQGFTKRFYFLAGAAAGAGFGRRFHISSRLLEFLNRLGIELIQRRLVFAFGDVIVAAL